MTAVRSERERAPTALSLFSGAGGCSLGFAQAGFRVIYASDVDADAVATYRENFPETPCDQQDICDLDPGLLMFQLGLRPGQLDALIGGPPCQGFSSAGGRDAADPRNKLLKRYAEVMGVLKPKWFLMENVEGLLTADGGNYVHDVVETFLSLGYGVRVEKVYAQEHGVPQRRKRVLVVGNCLGIDFPFPTPETNVRGPIFRSSDVTLMYAIGDLPAPSAGGISAAEYEGLPQNPLQAYFRCGSTRIADHEAPALGADVKRRIKALKVGQTMKDLPEELHHRSFKQRALRRVMDGTPSEKRGGAPSGLKRLAPNEPCLTITGAATREFIHPFQDRPLTLRECARIQTFPDRFAFHGSASGKATQIGNAIPPLLARKFAEHVRAMGFTQNVPAKSGGRLLGFTLTKAGGMSPALEKTMRILETLLEHERHAQRSLF